MSLYQPTNEQIDALIRERPLALILSVAEAEIVITPLPVMLEGSVAFGGVLVGHFARTNPHLTSLAASPRAVFIFTGVDGYISPSWLSDRTQAPTWNFQIVQITAEVTLRPGRDMAVSAVDRLTEQMEAGRPEHWDPKEMGDRHARLAQGVVAFSAEITGVCAKFKLGQNEPPELLSDILAGLGRVGRTDLQAAVRDANLGRIGPQT